MSIFNVLMSAPALSGGGFGGSTAVIPSGFEWRNRSIFVGRFPSAGGVVSFDHCTSADVRVHKAGAWTKWHDYFGPGPCP